MDYFAMPTTGQMLAILFAFVLTAPSSGPNGN